MPVLGIGTGLSTLLLVGYYSVDRDILPFVAGLRVVVQSRR